MKGCGSNRGSRSHSDRRMKGGGSEWMDKVLENLKKIFKVSTYKYLFSMLLAISCIFFIFATIIFVNACINLHKTSFVYPTDDTTKYRKLIDAPIFEYLKTRNFLAVDKFLLNANSSLKPSSIAFWTVIGIMLGVLLLLVAHYLALSNNTGIIEYNQCLKNNIWYVVIAWIPYFYIFIIAIVFNSIQVNNNNDLNNLIIVSDIEYKKDELQNIKKELQKILYENEAFVTEGIVEGIEKRFKLYKYIAPAPDTANTSVGKTNIAIDLEAIISIYKHNLSSLNLSGDKLKQYQRKYINYIDEYFELLNYNGSNSDDNYTKFYLYGLIEYKDGDLGAYSGRIKEYRDKIKDKGGYGLEKLLITTITSNIRSYFIAVISLYTIYFFLVIIALIYLNDAAKMPLVHMLYFINKIVSIETLSIIILTIIAIAAIITTSFFVIPLIYNSATTTLSSMLNK